MTTNIHPVAFREVQHLRQWWLRLLVVAIALSQVAIFGYGMYQQLVMGEPFGDNPMPDGWLMGMGIGAVLLSLGLLWLIFAAKLITEVRDDGVYYKYFPFFRTFHRMGFNEIAEVEPTEYSPIGEYGGWGIRMSLGGRGMAYNASGNKGVRFKTRDGKQRLLGAQHADELAMAVRQAMARNSGK